MGTLTIQATGFANTPVNPPANWPSNVNWPSNQVTNGTKTYTVSDADWVSLITWVAYVNFSSERGTPSSPTATQLLLVWVQGWINTTLGAVQRFFTPPPSPPPQIGIS